MPTLFYFGLIEYYKTAELINFRSKIFDKMEKETFALLGKNK